MLASSVHVAGPDTYRKYYEYEADVYRIDPEHEAAFPHRRTLVRRLLPPDPGPRVLDAGCGDGALSADLRELTSSKVCGVDIALKRARHATGSANGGAFQQASIYELPYRDGAFSLPPPGRQTRNPPEAIRSAR